MEENDDLDAELEAEASSLKLEFEASQITIPRKSSQSLSSSAEVFVKQSA